jgi:outer membrane autotransporter protein
LPTVSGGTTSIDQVANGEPGGGLFSAALTFGGDFNSKAWAFSPYGQVIYSRMDFDAYEENLQAGPGIGLGLAVEERQITSLTGILGARLSYTYSASWGVFAPLASVEFDHEFKSDAEAITARFLYDPTQTPFSVAGAPIDSSYMRLGLGLTMVFTHGKSGFLLFQRLLAREGQSQDNLSLGVRIEF